MVVVVGRRVVSIGGSGISLIGCIDRPVAAGTGKSCTSGQAGVGWDDFRTWLGVVRHRVDGSSRLCLWW